MADAIRHYISSPFRVRTVCGIKYTKNMYVTQYRIAVLDDVQGCVRCKRWLSQHDIKQEK